MPRLAFSALLAAALAAVALISPAPAQTYTVPEVGLENSGNCPQFAVRDRGTKAMSPIGCLEGGMWSLKPKKLEFQGQDAQVSMPSSGGYWRDNPNPANFTRLNDRVLVGKATEYDGTYAGNFPNWQWNMGRGIYAYLPRIAQMNVVSSYGQLAGLFAADSQSGNNLPGYPSSTCCAGAIGLQVLNNNTERPQGMWMLYGTGVRLPGTGSLVNEIDLANATPDVIRMNPFTPPQNGVGATIGLALQSGGEAVEIVNGAQAFPHLSAATMAMLIAGNGSTWDRGIVFRQLSISDQYPKAVDMPANYRVRWTHDDSDQTEAFISSNVGDYSKAMGIQFTQYGAMFQDPTLTQSYAQIAHVPNAVNRPVLAGSTTGQDVVYGADGSDTNVGVQIKAKGSSTINLIGNSTALIGAGGTCIHTPGTSNETVSCFSDERLKSDIVDAGSALPGLRDLRVRDFTVKADGTRRTGVIAQETRETHPEMVHEGADGLLSVDTPNPWLLVKAIQELEVRVRWLSAAVAVLTVWLLGLSGLLVRRAAV